MVSDIVTGPAIRNTLTSIKQINRTLDETSLRLATGRRVNSALDQPQNFFNALSLQNRANDFDRLLDGINQSIFTIQEALTGVKAITRLLNQAEAIALRTQDLLRAGETDPAVIIESADNSPSPLSSQILGQSPVAYYRFNETGGAVANNLGTAGAALNGTYQNGVTLGASEIYTNGGDVNASFDGANDRVAIPNSPLINQGSQPTRTIEVVFNANTTAGRQVIYEEGGNTNAINIYIDNGQLYFNARDAGDFGPFTLTAPVTAGETYHATLVFDSASNELRGYLDGNLVGTGFVNGPIDNHPGAIGVGRLNGSSFLHDGPSPGNTFAFNGQISDLALYNTVLSDSVIQSHAESLETDVSSRFINEDFDKVLNQIDQIVEDANYRGVNLLAGENLITDFNEDRSNRLETKGQDFTYNGLGIPRFDFDTIDNVDVILNDVRDALKRVRQYGRTLASDLGVISTRESFTQKLINNHLAGADDLTIADLNEEGAKMLASQTRLDLGIASLNTAALSQTSILDVVTGNA